MNIKVNPGTIWPIETDSLVWPVSVLALQDSVRERSKAAPDGRPTFSTGAMLRVQSKDGTVRLDRGSSVHVIEPPAEPLVIGAEYVSDGAVFPVPYLNDAGKLVYSITVERLVLVSLDNEEVK